MNSTVNYIEQLERRVKELEHELYEIRGTPVSMARSLFDLAEELGKSKVSSDSPAEYIRKHIAKLNGLLRRIRDKPYLLDDCVWPGEENCTCLTCAIERLVPKSFTETL